MSWVKWRQICLGLNVHRWPVIYLRKGPVTRKSFPYHDVIMGAAALICYGMLHCARYTLIYYTVHVTHCLCKEKGHTGSCNGLSPGRHQVFAWNNTDIQSVGMSVIEIQPKSRKQEMHFQTSTGSLKHFDRLRYVEDENVRAGRISTNSTIPVSWHDRKCKFTYQQGCM